MIDLASKFTNNLTENQNTLANTRYFYSYCTITHKLCHLSQEVLAQLEQAGYHYSIYILYIPHSKQTAVY